MVLSAKVLRYCGDSQREIDGKVLASTAIANGKVSTFDVTFPPSVRPDTIGLLILVLGTDNYGAFIPPAAQ
jgi:hypothetical protein